MVERNELTRDAAAADTERFKSEGAAPALAGVAKDETGGLDELGYSFADESDCLASEDDSVFADGGSDFGVLLG